MQGIYPGEPPRHQELPRREDLPVNTAIHLIAREAFVLLASAFVYACSQSMQAAVSVFIIGTILAIFPQPIYLMARVSSRVFVGSYHRGVIFVRWLPRPQYVQMIPFPNFFPQAAQHQRKGKRVVRVQPRVQLPAHQPPGGGGGERVVRVQPRGQLPAHQPPRGGGGGQRVVRVQSR